MAFIKIVKSQKAFIVEWLVLQTIHLQKKSILRFLGLKSAVSNQNQVFKIARVRYMQRKII